jgi:hypothetical protein
MTDGLLPVQACLNRMANPDALDGEPVKAVTISERVKRPWRDPEVLQRAWVRATTVGEVSERLGCGHTTAGLWLEVYGYRSRSANDHGLGLARRIRAADDPDEVLGDD